MSQQPHTYKWQLTYNSLLVRTANSHKVHSRTHTSGCISSIYFMNQNMTSANSETWWRKQEDHAENPDAAGRGLKMLWARFFHTSQALLYWHLVVVSVNCNKTESRAKVRYHTDGKNQPATTLKNIARISVRSYAWTLIPHEMMYASVRQITDRSFALLQSQ